MERESFEPSNRILPVLGAAWLIGLFYLTTGFVPPGDAAEISLSLRRIAPIGLLLVIPGVLLLKFLGNSSAPAPPSFGMKTILAAIGAGVGAHLLLVLFLPGTEEAKSLARVFLPQLTAALVLWNATPRESRDRLVPRSGPGARAAFGWGLAATCLLIALLAAIVLAADVLHVAAIAERSLGARPVDLRRDLIEIILAVILIPLGEEILFRVGLIGWLMKWCSARWAVVLSAVVFATLHMQSEILWARLLGGLFMGWVYLRSGTLLAPWVLHALMNGGLLLTPLVWNTIGG